MATVMRTPPTKWAKFQRSFCANTLQVVHPDRPGSAAVIRRASCCSTAAIEQTGCSSYRDLITLTRVLLNPGVPFLCKHCGSRSVIWICVFISTSWTKYSDWMKIRSGRIILTYSASVRVIKPRNVYGCVFA